MSHRLFTTLLVLSFGLLLAGSSFAQDTATQNAAADGAVAADESADESAQPTEATPPETAIDDPDDIFGPIDDEEPMAADETADDATEQASPSDFPQQPAPSGGMADSTTAAPAANAEVDELRERVAALETELEELKATLSTMQQNLASVDQPGDLSNAALGAMQELRSDLPRITQGKVRLLNNTGQDQVMYINGTAWTVVPGRSFVYAPVGTVAFQVDDTSRPVFKGIQEWSENRDNGQMELEVVVGDASTATASTTTERSVLTDLPDRGQ